MSNLDKNQLAQILLVQKHQTDSSETQLGAINSTMDSLQMRQTADDALLNELLVSARLSLESSNGVSDFVGFSLSVESSVRLHRSAEKIEQLETLDVLDFDDRCSAEDYYKAVKSYAEKHKIELEEDPFRRLMPLSQRIQLEKRIRDDFSYKTAQCDQYDYLIAGSCGLIGGLIDVFFVGAPGSSALGKVADGWIDKSVEKFASLNGWTGPREGKDSVASAIGFLERKFPVNYDHRHGGDVAGVFDMSTRNHHIKSLAHSPDLIGLFFSLVGQFTSTAHFVDGGALITVDTKSQELQGSSFAAKIFCGFVNWLGHLFSDMAGSSGAQGRGSGVPIPFYSLLQFVEVGSFGQHRQSFAKVAVQVFEQGYDLRHGVAMAIPVLITELLTRFGWTLKQRIVHKKPWLECLPTANNPELRRMLVVAHGTLCLVDGVDATLKSGGTAIGFMLHANIIAWARFGMLAMKELSVMYRSGSLDHDAVDVYLEEELNRLMTYSR